MTAPVEMTPQAQPGAILKGVSGAAIEGRSPGQIAWMRLRRDRVAMAGGIYIVFLILVAIIGPHLVQNPDTFHPNLVNPTFSRPIGPWGGISLAHPLGVEPVTGRDVLARIVNGARVSMLIAFLATALLVFAIALVGVNPSSAFGLSGNSLRIGLLIFVIGFFAWPYMGRIIRGQTLSLREREFVDAARSL